MTGEQKKYSVLFLVMITASLMVPYAFYGMYITLALILGIAVFFFYRKKTVQKLAFFLLAIPTVTGFLDMETTEFRLDRVAGQLDQYKEKNGFYPVNLSEIEIVLPSYKGLKSEYLSAGNYFAIKYEVNAGFFGDSIGYTSVNRNLEVQASGWDG